MGCFNSGNSDKKGSSKSRKLCCCIKTLGVLFIAGIVTWYITMFAKDVESPLGDCGGCYCIPDASTSFECPGTEAPQSSFPEETHLDVWKSHTILNPYELNCNPFKDGVFCDTEPPLDPDFEWIKLGETAVCAIHFEPEEPQERRLYGRRQEEQDSEIDLVGAMDVGDLTSIDLDHNITNGEGENDFDIDLFGNDDEDNRCQNSGFYRIKTYPSREDAESAGGFVSHVGHCGVCSTLQDLAVYANVDFIAPTSPGNFCRRQAATSFENGLACYRGLGMTQDCAKIWADTSWNTARNCFGSCVVGYTLPQFGGDANSGNDYDVNSTESADKWYDLPVTLRNKFRSASNATKQEDSEEEEIEEKAAVAIPSNGPAPECALNSCITCNDEVSAPTFERFAGRTRQRSGLLSTAARPCHSLPNIVHDPCPITLPLVE
eukprot:CAMPEP_0197175304 /NCGR_PEP_ID=MMETSP1423-20130617/1564_1 /TAXON_ID=476441 /ORGANISM="Pseudo-nitzschia heimii, Strain UNC1101" /LENGTH=432 /DNA_ID=CAMNT_0042624427 /DNA_START=93 /DNA_END=1391 /DNA_ORIENTATION=-